MKEGKKTGGGVDRNRRTAKDENLQGEQLAEVPGSGGHIGEAEAARDIASAEREMLHSSRNQS
jgi:hypothetical protein